MVIHTIIFRLLGIFSTCCLLISTVKFIKCSDELKRNELEFRDKDWDVLSFVQQWPVSVCVNWLEANHSHKCYISQIEGLWTAHGIWASKYGGKGAHFCNISAKFEINALDPIVDSLKRYWPSVEFKQSALLWKHEWIRHGTCAASLPALRRQLDYFKQGLIWREKYDIAKILGASGIHPNSSTSIEALRVALQKILGRNPYIHCIYDPHTYNSYLTDIRLCFNKELELVDCDRVFRYHMSFDHPQVEATTNCPISEPVQYPSVIPPTTLESWKFPFENQDKTSLSGSNASHISFGSPICFAVCLHCALSMLKSK